MKTFIRRLSSAKTPLPSPSPSSILPSFFNRILPDDGLTKEQREFKSRERKVIFDQLQRGKLSDALKAGAGRDKLFLASNTIAESSTVYFPDTPLSAVSAQLDNSIQNDITLSAIFGKSEATVVTIAFQALGQQMLQPWHSALFNKTSGISIIPVQWNSSSSSSSNPSNPSTTSSSDTKGDKYLNSIQFLNIIYLQGWFFKIFSSIMLTSIKRALDSQTASSSAVTFEPSLQKMDHFCEKLAIHNRMMGYIFIVNKDGKVVWSAHGQPTIEELDNFLQACKKSIKRG